jgi:hypothetical protein
VKPLLEKAGFHPLMHDPEGYVYHEGPTKGLSKTLPEILAALKTAQLASRRHRGTRRMGISRRVRGGYPQAYKAYGGGIHVLVLMKVISQRSVELEEHDPVLSAKSYKRAAREPVSHRNDAISLLRYRIGLREIPRVQSL